MVFHFGDNIAGESITTGQYLGRVEMYEKEFHKVFDSSKKLVVFIPVGNESKMRKLPGVKLAKRYLKILQDNDLIDTQEIEGSRYKYYKQKLEVSSFKSSIEVLHDLYILNKNKKSSVSEKNYLYP